VRPLSAEEVPDLKAATQDPAEHLYWRDGERIEVERDGPGPAVGYRGFSKDPLEIVVAIPEDPTRFRLSTDGGATFSEAQTNPVAGGPSFVYSTDSGWRRGRQMPPVWIGDPRGVWSTDGGKSFSREVPPPRNATWSTDGGKSFSQENGPQHRAAWSTDGGQSWSAEPPPREARYDHTVPGTLGIPWAIKFSIPKDPNNLLDDAFVGEWLHPTQLYLALNVLLIGLILLARLRFKPWFPGELVALGMILYGITRFLIEFTRGDVARGFHGTFSTSQWVSFPFLVVGIFLYLRFYLRYRKQKASVN
jgi:hypothetical protein